jgi:hypothetical protein
MTNHLEVLPYLVASAFLWMDEDQRMSVDNIDSLVARQGFTAVAALLDTLFDGSGLVSNSEREGEVAFRSLRESKS